DLRSRHSVLNLSEKRLIALDGAGNDRRKEDREKTEPKRIPNRGRSVVHVGQVVDELEGKEGQRERQCRRDFRSPRRARLTEEERPQQAGVLVVEQPRHRNEEGDDKTRALCPGAVLGPSQP